MIKEPATAVSYKIVSAARHAQPALLVYERAMRPWNFDDNLSRAQSG